MKSEEEGVDLCMYVCVMNAVSRLDCTTTARSLRHNIRGVTFVFGLGLGNNEWKDEGGELLLLIIQIQLLSNKC